MATWRRTHTCGELRLDNVGKSVRLNGWVHNWRDHGGLVFLDIRDRFGITQVVFDPTHDAEMHERARTLRTEHVVAVKGVVADRDDRRSEKISTGDIEIKARELTILNRSEPPPFEIGTEADPASEEIRLRYRFLDLRRPAMQKILVLRHELCAAMRSYLTDHGFLEIETPILGRSTPEGARDFLVPSRIHHGNFYALPQSPQLYKQILMIAGYDKYFQVARCFRDEDFRANRQPEFTQLDIEMAFVDRDEVIETIERLAAHLLETVADHRVELPLPRYSWHDVMERFGVDRPDLRFGMELVDITDLAHQSEFGVFKRAPCVRGLCAKGAADKYSRKLLDELTGFVGEYGAKGLAWFKVEAEKLNAPTAKFLAPELQTQIRKRLGAEVGDLLLFVADQRDATHGPLAALRSRLGKELGLIDPDAMNLCWVVDFPMFEWNAEDERYVAMHHPFTAPLAEDWEKIESDPASARAQAYDLVINGEEAAGGTVRLHDPAQQATIFELIGLSPEQQQARFGFLLDALKFGAPPHGGIAFGLDRWVMLLAGLDNIRDGIAFPKTQRATDLMTGAPGEVDAKQLRELGLRID